jgi:eukaryotic-like serine/threonine-protein kinase
MTVPLAEAATEEDLEQARVRARVRQGLFGGAADPVRLEQFEITGRLGAGAMGVVYEARDTELDRVVALKLLHPALRESGHSVEELTERLLEEARAMARVKHPNVVTVHQVGTHGGQVYVAMERAKETLREWLERARPTPERVRDVMLATARGLAAVHRAGLVHRDFKLDNVLMDDDGQPRVSDFGLVQKTSETPSSGVLAGTPAYMPPEQLRGEGADARSDQWAWAATAVEAFTGRRPFEGETLEQLLDSALGRVKDSALAGVPPAVADVLRRALDPEPSARFSSMDALVERLESAPKPAPRWPLFAAIAIAAAVVGLVLASRRGNDAVPAPAPSAEPAPSASVAAPQPISDVTRLCRTATRASSEAPDHPAAHAFDGIPSTAWTEGAPGAGEGEWVEAELRPGTFVSEVEVSGGWAVKTSSGVDLWTHNSTFRRMRVSWDGGEKVIAFDHKSDRGKRKRVKVGATTRSIRITAIEVDHGRFKDLCLDEVAIFGRCAR